MHTRLTTSPTQVPLLKAIDLACQRDDQPLFEQLSFALRAEEALVLEGRNGTGKTSLLRIICGLRRPDSGEVYWMGVPIESCVIKFHRNLVFVGHMDGIKRELSPLENLQLLQTLCGKGRISIKQALDELNLTGFEDTPVHALSAGQRRRAALARLLVTDARLWVLDEPFTSLDRQGIQLVENLLARHLAAGGAIVMTSHHEVKLGAAAKHVLHLSG